MRVYDKVTRIYFLLENIFLLHGCNSGYVSLVIAYADVDGCKRYGYITCCSFGEFEGEGTIFGCFSREV